MHQLTFQPDENDILAKMGLYDSPCVVRNY